MITLKTLPKRLFVRHPSGELEGPMLDQEFIDGVISGRFSKFCWIYDDEKRLSAALHKFPDLYELHPNAKQSLKYFPNGKPVDLCYYISMLSIIGLFCFTFPGILLALLSIGVSFPVIKSTFSHPNFEVRYRLMMGLGISSITLIVGLGMILSILFKSV